MDHYPQLEWLESQGARFVKLAKGKKTPVERNWQAASRALSDIVPHVDSGGNVGVLCGGSSANICAFDIDKNFPKFLESFPELKFTARITRADAPDRGKVLVKVVGTLPAPKKWKPVPVEPPHAEFLGTGNQFVVPPSLHPDGAPFLLSNHDFSINEFSASELDAIWFKWTRTHLVEEPRPADTSPREAPKTNYAQLRELVRQRFDLVRYAAEVLKAETRDEADGQVRILGQGGLIINPAKRIWATFAEDGKTGGDCFDLVAFLTYHKTKVKGNEWREVFRLAADFAGVVLPDEYRQRDTPVTLEDEDGNTYTPSVAPDAITKDMVIAVRSARSILNTEFEELQWIIPGLLPPGLTVLAGRQKLGKSWLAMQIALGVAVGGRVLDKRVPAGGVLYLALEDNWIRLQKRMQQQQWDLPEHAVCDFMTLREFSTTVGDLRNGGGKKLAAAIQQNQYRLVVVDTLSRAVWGNQSDVDEMTRWLSPIQQIAFDNQAAIVMIDHHAKSLGGNNDPIADILGSSAKAAVADCIWGLYRERGKPTANLVVAGRDVEDQSLALKWDGPIGTWVLEGNTEDVQVNRQQLAICDVIRDYGPSTHTKIAEVTGLDKGYLSRLLGQMVFDRVLVTDGETRGKKYHLADRLPVTDTGEPYTSDDMNF